MTEAKQKRALFVVGMHRSGTSALARALSLAGAGLPRDLMRFGSHNLSGHWEPLPIAELNDVMLASLGMSWSTPFAPPRDEAGKLPLESYAQAARDTFQQQFGDQSLIVFKEPRSAILADFWCDVMRSLDYEPLVVLMTRDPHEVAASLAARDGFALNHGLLLWANYTAQAELLTRDLPRAFCSYEGLLERPSEVLGAIEATLKVKLPLLAQAEGEIASFLQKDLRHHLTTAEDPRADDALAPVYRLDRWINALVAGNRPKRDVPKDVAAWLRTLGDVFAPILKAQNALLGFYQQRLRCFGVAGGEIYDHLTRLRSAMARSQTEANTIEHLLGQAYRGEKPPQAPDDRRSFDPACYLFLNPDIAEAETDPLEHYTQFGKQEGRLY